MSNPVTFQDIRADQQLINSHITFDDDLFVYDDEAHYETDESGKNQKQKDSKRKRNRKKKPASTAIKAKNGPEKIIANGHDSTNESSNKENGDVDDKIEIEFVPEEITLDKNFAEFSRVFEHFKVSNSI